MVYLQAGFYFKCHDLLIDVLYLEPICFTSCIYFYFWFEFEFSGTNFCFLLSNKIENEMKEKKKKRDEDEKEANKKQKRGKSLAHLLLPFYNILVSYVLLLLLLCRYLNYVIVVLSIYKLWLSLWYIALLYFTTNFYLTWLPIQNDF